MDIAATALRGTVPLCLLSLVLPNVAPFVPGTQAQDVRIAQLSVQLPPNPRDFFVGQWIRRGAAPFPQEIIMEVDPASADRLLVSFKFQCQRQSPECIADKTRSNPAFLSGGAPRLPMVPLHWFKDAAGNDYSVSFQMMRDQDKLEKSAAREVNAIFSVTLPSNMSARFGGTLPNELRYYIRATKPAPAPQQVPPPRLNVVPR